MSWAVSLGDCFTPEVCIRNVVARLNLILKLEEVSLIISKPAL